MRASVIPCFVLLFTACLLIWAGAVVAGVW